MDETITQPAADPSPTAAPADPGEAPTTAQAPEAAPAVAAALDADTAQPAVADPAAADPAPDGDLVETPEGPHPFIAAMRQELDKITGMPAHIWHEIERAFERVAAKL